MSVGAVNKSTGERIQAAGMPVIDAALSRSSTNPVQNRVVKAALDEKADTDIVASDFSTAVSYTAGNYCIYEGKFYKFKANHSGAWSAADVDEIKIAGELSSLMSGLNNHFKTLSSGSLHDITQSGIYYLTGSVTDKPIGLGGMYIVSVYSSAMSVGLYISYLDDSSHNQVSIVAHHDDTWDVVDITSTPRT